MCQPDEGIFSIEVSSFLDALARCLENRYPQLASGRFAEVLIHHSFPRLKFREVLLSCKEIRGKRQEMNSWQSLAVS